MMDPDNHHKLLVGDPKWQINDSLKMSKFLSLEPLNMLGYMEKSN